MSKVLGVVGSPRKNGNTDVLVTKILEGVQLTNGETEKILLNELLIRECDGCHICWRNKPCNKNDDMNHLYDKIIKSDVILFGTPVYWYGPTALMKIFIDRFVYFNCPEHRSKIKGKKAVLVIPYEEQNLETVEPVLTFFEKSLQYLEIKIIGKIIVPGVTKKGEVLRKIKTIDSCIHLGKHL